MHLIDEAYTTFYANKGLIYYKVTLFGLVKTVVTYQRMINKLFKGMMWWNMEAYIDDMLVKFVKVEMYVTVLWETFESRSMHTFLTPSNSHLGEF